MKNSLLILILILFSCKSKKIGTETYKPQFELGIDVNAKISRIDSIENYYFVFIENDKDFFKVISKKNQVKHYSGKKVEIGKSYKFKIQQLTDRRPSAKKDQFTSMNYFDISKCLNFNGIEICTESSFELAKSSNMKGLYLNEYKTCHNTVHN
jgi:hypothetical protein